MWTAGPAAPFKRQGGNERGKGPAREGLRNRPFKAGMFAVSRFDPVTGAEMLIAFNSSGAAWSGNVQVETGSTRFTALAGQCPGKPAAPGSIVSIPAFGYVVCAAGGPE